MYCPTCGSELAEGTELCPVCGMDLKGYNKNDGKMNVEKSMDVVQEVKNTVKKKFIQTVAGKIVVGVAGVVLAGGIAGGVGYYIHSQKEKTDTPNDEKQIEASTGEETSVTEIAEATTEEVTTGVTTEEVTEAVTEEVTTEAEDEDAYKTAYRDILTSNSEKIAEYDWQNGYSYVGSIPVPTNEATPVALCDITGDGVPELFYAWSTSADTGILSADVTIYTYEDGEAKEIYTEGFASEIAAGLDCFLFQSGDSSDLYEYNSTGDETMYYTYIQYAMGDDGKLYAEHTWTKSSGPNADYTAMVNTYTLDGADITETEYNDKVDELQKNIKSVILSNYGAEDMLNEFAGDAKKKYMTYDKAKKKLKVKKKEESSGKESGVAEIPHTLPEGMPDSFYMSSGAGAWGTSVTINSDGTFEGSYYDTDMGVSGDGYAVTMYVCNFSGSFKNIKMVDEYTYSMELDTISVEKEAGEEWIEDNVRYVASEPYGFDNGEEFLLYLPGAPMDELPEEFVYWISMPRAWDSYSTPDELPCYGLYNVNGEYGFQSSDN